MKSDRLPFVCPVCDEPVPRGAKSCPECGACEKSGWGADGAGDGLGIEEDDFDYDQFIAGEFGGKLKTSGKVLFWRWAAVIVLCILAWVILHGAFL